MTGLNMANWEGYQAAVKGLNMAEHHGRQVATFIWRCPKCDLSGWCEFTNSNYLTKPNDKWERHWLNHHAQARYDHGQLNPDCQVSMPLWVEGFLPATIK